MVCFPPTFEKKATSVCFRGASPGSSGLLAREPWIHHQSVRQAEGVLVYWGSLVEGQACLPSVPRATVLSLLQGVGQLVLAVVLRIR